MNRRPLRQAFRRAMNRWLGAGRLLLALAAVAPIAARAMELQVVDAATGAPLPGADVVVDGRPLRADAQGLLPLPPEATRVIARAIGHGRVVASVPALPAASAPGADPATATASARWRLPLPPRRPKALYLSAWGIGDAGLRGDALDLARRTEIDALVVDVKGDASIVPFRSAAYAQSGLGEQVPVTVRDMAAMLRTLHDEGLYLIARVVVFKDHRYAGAHPEWAVHDRAGRVWLDREGLAWIDPSRREAWGFALGVAEEAAALGFDEVQFDYVRFPDASGLVFRAGATQDERVGAITGFLDAARARLAPHGVFLSADIFGYVCWNENDTELGQQLEALLPHVDYLSPMLYPSGFTWGIPGHRDPVAEPYDIVRLTLQRAVQRTGASPLRFRPWLQAFTDYAFDHREFGAPQVRAQVRAAQDAGTDGWMLWNPRNRYSAGAGGLEP